VWLTRQLVETTSTTAAAANSGILRDWRYTKQIGGPFFMLIGSRIDVRRLKILAFKVIFLRTFGKPFRVGCLTLRLGKTAT
jgi:hypothetical protein